MSASRHQDLSSNKQHHKNRPNSSKPSTHSQIGYFEILEYPTTNIMTCFLTFGGVLGGFIIWVPFALSNKSYILESLMTALLGGAVIGIIPSFIVALMVVKQEKKLQQSSDWWDLFCLGSIVSFLYMLFIVLVIVVVSKGAIFKGMNGLNEFLLIITLSVTAVGGLSSLILGSFVLPKH